MTAAVPRALAERLALECDAAASSLLRLQGTLGEAILSVEMSTRLVKDLQSLDTVAQTLEDLGAVFGAIAASDATRETMLASISQASLRKRLEGSTDPDAERDVDLF